MKINRVKSRLFQILVCLQNPPEEKSPPKKKGLIRKLDTPENRAFWAGVDKAAKEIESWPEWKKNCFKKRGNN